MATGARVSLGVRGPDPRQAGPLLRGRPDQQSDAGRPGSQTLETKERSRGTRTRSAFTFPADAGGSAPHAPERGATGPSAGNTSDQLSAFYTSAASREREGVSRLSLHKFLRCNVCVMCVTASL